MLPILIHHPLLTNQSVSSSAPDENAKANENDSHVRGYRPFLMLMYLAILWRSTKIYENFQKHLLLVSHLSKTPHLHKLPFPLSYLYVLHFLLHR